MCCSDFCADLIENEKNVAVIMYGDAELVPYDGRNVADILNKLHQDAMTSATARYEKNKITAGLRSGNPYLKCGDVSLTTRFSPMAQCSIANQNHCAHCPCFMN
jgi:hypothetical protein